MSFKVLDVDKFIKSVNAKMVSRAQTFDRNFEPYNDGLQSKTIFGASTKEKFSNYGYIDLKTVVLHPLIYDNLSKVNTIFNKVIDNKGTFVIEDGMIIEAPGGNSGLAWLIENWDSLQFNKYRTERNKIFIDFINNTQKNIIVIDKIPVIPVVYRESFVGSNNIIESNEIDDIYKKILSLVTDTNVDFQSAYLKAQNKSKKESIQFNISQLYKYFIKKLEAKSGFFRNAMAGKRLDNVARMVANARPDIPVDAVAVPWHILLNIFDIFVVAFLQQEENKSYLDKLGIGDPHLEAYGELFDYIYRNVDTYIKYYPGKEEIWIDILTQIFNKNEMLRVFLKRDPGWNADSFHCLKPVIRTGVSYEIIVNSLYYSPLGGDSFNSNFMLDTADEGIISEDDEYLIYSDSEHVNVIRTMDTIYKRID